MNLVAAETVLPKDQGPGSLATKALCMCAIRDSNPEPAD